MWRSKWFWLILVHLVLIGSSIVLAQAKLFGMLPIILGYGGSMGALSLIGAWASRLPDHLADLSEK